ncbi:MAG: hypothetical protein DRQ88_12765 [Epsilonproteobacteria bacterium]|nr:MAG: hypothetical protein DRQ88_12765 [Campylobacterota bacterium]RLA63690.1 MAG: hypothetical protein DRQ89_05860 [Campylobacterota bacterium]
MKFIILLTLLLSFNSFSSGGKKKKSEEESRGVMNYILGDRSCGQLGQPRCRVWVKEYWDMVNFGCDRGLSKRWSWSSWRHYCSPGSRFSNRPVPYISGSHKFQRELVRKKPFSFMSSVVPHNSIGYKKAGPTLMSNQFYSPTDLLNMGIRILAADVHKVHGNFRAIHCNQKIKVTCNVQGRYWAAYLEEIKLWMNKNPNEVIVMYLEDTLNGDIKSFAYIIEKIIGANKVFSKQDLAKFSGGGYPSLDYIRSKGRRVVFFNQSNSSHNFVHGQGSKFWPRWPSAYVKNFNGNTCYLYGKKINGSSGEGFKNKYFVGFMESDGKVLGLDLKIVYDPTKDSGKVTLDSIRDAAKCGMTYLEMDWVDNSKVNAAIWSWATGEPRSWGRGRNCTKQRNGRWYGVYCTERKQHACRHKTNSFDWKVTSKSGVFTEGPANCTAQFGSDYYFALPTVGDQNEELRKKIGNNRDVWMNFSTGINWSNVGSGVVRALNTSQTSISNGTYQIRPKISNKFLTEAGSYSIQYSYLRSRSKARQQWVVEKQSDGYFLIKNKKTGKCLDSFSDRNGGRIGVYSCHKRDGQKWKFINKGLNTFQLQNKRSKRCMDLNGSKRRNWNQTINWKCYNVRQHYYTLIRQ